MAGTGTHGGTRTMWLALAGYSALFVLKLIAYFYTHLGVMFAEAMHSTADMLISAFLLAAAYISARPADEEFRFGYGRAQNIAALVAATIFISFTSLETLREAIPKLFHPQQHGPEGLSIAVGVIIISIVISALPLTQMARSGSRGAAEKAQLLECVNDEIALAAALAGTLLVAKNVAIADPIASIVVALVIAFNALNLWRENATLLMGASPGKAFYDDVNRIAFSIPGVLEVHNVIAEQVGDQIHLGMHVEVQPGIVIEEADAIGDSVADAMRQAYDGIYVVVHVDPKLASEGDERAMA
jgi:ferrous-iron efflux pump FieF